MAWKRSAAEAVTCAAGWVVSPRRRPANPPESIFVLRNNDLGDLLVVTPLFDALRRRFPSARIVAGVGAWNVATLEGNPHVSEVMAVSAPWFNRVTGAQGPRAAIRYLSRSSEVRQLRARRFDVGIDVLGSVWGSWLLLRAGVPLRLGVKGYAGGHTAVQRFVRYNPDEHVGRSALRFAELLGAVDLPDARPQLFLSPAEMDEAERLWREADPERLARRIVIAPGGGHPGRAWPLDHFVDLTRRLIGPAARPLVIGGDDDVESGQRIAAAGARDMTGQLTLRQSFAAIACADIVFCNSSVAMHAAAAAGVPAVVLLGPEYGSARAHANQWGHGDLSLILGRDIDRNEIYAPGDALHAALARYPSALSPGDSR